MQDFGVLVPAFTVYRETTMFVVVIRKSVPGGWSVWGCQNQPEKLSP
jgi:hypothetical protein